jgi:hypothetical protein
MAEKLCPAVALGINFTPLVKKLGGAKDRGQAVKRLFHFLERTCPEIEDKNCRAVDKRISALVQKITVASHKYQSMLSRIRELILIQPADLSGPCLPWREAS